MDVLSPVYIVRRGKGEYLQLVNQKRNGGFYTQFTIDAYSAAKLQTKKQARETAMILAKPGEDWTIVEFHPHKGGMRRNVLTMSVEG